MLLGLRRLLVRYGVFGKLEIYERFFFYTESFQRSILFQTQREEAKKFAEIKRTLRQEIQELRQTVLQMMNDNQQAPEIERLDRHEYNLDVDQRQKLVLEGEEKIKQV